MVHIIANELVQLYRFNSLSINTMALENNNGGYIRPLPSSGVDKYRAFLATLNTMALLLLSISVAFLVGRIAYPLTNLFEKVGDGTNGEILYGIRLVSVPRQR